MSKFRTSRSEPLLQPFHFQKDSKTQPQFAFDCDINNIVLGMTQPLPTRAPLSAEFSNTKQFSPDMYEKALYTKAAAENAFNSLPSNVREFFGNNPKKLLEFIQDPKNDKKCIELGLKVVNEEKTFQNELLSSVKKSSSKTEKADSVTPTESVGN